MKIILPSRTHSELGLHRWLSPWPQWTRPSQFCGPSSVWTCLDATVWWTLWWTSWWSVHPIIHMIDLLRRYTKMLTLFTTSSNMRDTIWELDQPWNGMSQALTAVLEFLKRPWHMFLAVCLSDSILKALSSCSAVCRASSEQLRDLEILIDEFIIACL